MEKSHLDLQFEKLSADDVVRPPWIRNLYWKEKQSFSDEKFKLFEHFNNLCLLKTVNLQREESQRKKEIDTLLRTVSEDKDLLSHNTIVTLTRYYRLSAFNIRTRFGDNSQQYCGRRADAICDIISSSLSGDLHVSHTHAELLVRYSTHLHYSKQIYLNSCTLQLTNYEFSKLSQIKINELLRSFADFILHRQFFLSNQFKHCLTLHTQCPVNFFDHGAPMRLFVGRFKALSSQLKENRKCLEDGCFQPPQLLRLAADACYQLVSKQSLSIILNISMLETLQIPKTLKYYILHRNFYCYENSANFYGIQPIWHADSHIKQRIRFLSSRGSNFRHIVAPYENVLFEPNENVLSYCNNRCMKYFFYNITTCSYMTKMKNIGTTVNHSGDSDLCCELRTEMIRATNYDTISLLRNSKQRILVKRRVEKMTKYMDNLMAGWKVCCLNYFKMSLYWPHIINSVDHPHFHNF